MVGRTPKTPLTLEIIERHLAYTPDSGELRWLLDSYRRMRAKAGDVAGSDNGNGYIQVGLLGNNCPAHRLAWALTHKIWPVPHGIDHINGVRNDNRLCNLRAATQAENTQNRVGSRASKTGVKGVVYWKGAYMAQIGYNYKSIYLGRYSTLEEAKQAYEDAARRLQGEFFRNS